MTMHARLLPLLLASSLVAPGCVTTTTTRRVLTDVAPQPERTGRVESVQETVRRTEGQPGMGAVAGAVVGGLLGGMLTGRGPGVAIGAVSGAIVGAQESQGSSEVRTYDVAVRFDDGGTRIFTFRGFSPFRPGQSVSLTPRGLVPLDTFAVAPAPAATPPPSSSGDASLPPSTPAPEARPPPPPQSAGSPSPVPSGEWTFTQQYGWLWMPFGPEYAFTPDYDSGDPYMYVYHPGAGWLWLEAPWLWGWGPRPYFRDAGVAVSFTWYGQGWGERWAGRRPVGYRGDRAHPAQRRRVPAR
jgi:outer membrane lipoprotein SlyB